VTRVPDCALVGWDEQIYRYEVERLYQKNWAQNRSIMLGIHLFLLAKNTSNDIGGDTKIIVAKDTGISALDKNDIQELEGRVTMFNEKLSELAVMCPDLSIHNDEFRGYLKNLVDYVLEWREHYLDRAATSLLDRADNDPNFKGTPMLNVPPDTLIARGTHGQPFILSRNETEAYIRGAANPLTPPNSETAERQDDDET
jgi:hypothetical protein